MSMVDHLVRLAGMKVFVPGHPRDVPSGVTWVDNYWRTITSVADLKDHERKAILKEALEHRGTPKSVSLGDAIQTVNQRAVGRGFTIPRGEAQQGMEIRALRGGVPWREVKGRGRISRAASERGAQPSMESELGQSMEDLLNRNPTLKRIFDDATKSEKQAFRDELQARREAGAALERLDAPRRRVSGVADPTTVRRGEASTLGAVGRLQAAATGERKRRITDADLDRVEARAALRPGDRKARLQVRPKRYGTGAGLQTEVDGFVISGTDTFGRRVKIAVPTREEAERVRARIKAGSETGLDSEYEEGKWDIADIRDIVSSRQYKTVRSGKASLPVDMQTANMLATVHDALGPEEQKRFRSMPLQRAVSVGWKLTGRAGAQTTGDRSRTPGVGTTRDLGSLQDRLLDEMEARDPSVGTRIAAVRTRRAQERGELTEKAEKERRTHNVTELMRRHGISDTPANRKRIRGLIDRKGYLGAEREIVATGGGGRGPFPPKTGTPRTRDHLAKARAAELGRKSGGGARANLDALNRRDGAIQDAYGSGATPSEIADHIGMPEKDVRRVLRKHWSNVSLESGAQATGDYGWGPMADRPHDLKAIASRPELKRHLYENHAYSVDEQMKHSYVRPPTNAQLQEFHRYRHEEGSRFGIDPDPRGIRAQATGEGDEFLRRADGSIYGTKPTAGDQGTEPKNWNPATGRARPGREQALTEEERRFVKREGRSGLQAERRRQSELRRGTTGGPNATERLQQREEARQARARAQRARPSAQATGESGGVIGEGRFASAPTKSGHRALSQIAAEIRADWGAKTNFAAKPYLDAMLSLNDITDNYMADSASSIVSYLLGNMSAYRGEKAKRIKAELKAILKKAR